MYWWKFVLIIYCVTIKISGDEIELCSKSWNITCDCENNEEEGLDFFCPQKENFKINILVTNDEVILKCDKAMCANDYETISSINFGEINRRYFEIFTHTKYIFENCVIPSDGFKNIAPRLQVTKSKEDILALTDFQTSDNILRREHFNGFGEINTLFLKSTESVTLSSNAFDYFTDTTGIYLALPNLKGMSGELFLNQQKLKKLWLNETAVNFTTEFFIHLTSITTLYILSSVHGNTLGSNAFELLHNLQEIILVGNNLISLPSGLFHSNRLITDLTIREPDLKTLPDDLLVNLKHLNEFTLTFSSIETIHVDFFEKTTQLTTIRMSDNKLKSLPHGIFRNLKIIEQIRLNNNELKTLPDSLLFGLSAIYLINLRNNSLMTYPTFIKSSSSIEILDLCDNYIDQVTSTNLLFTTSDIYLLNNQLTTIDFSDIALTLSTLYSRNQTLQIKLHLEDNPIHCDDRLEDFIYYLQNPNKSFEIDAIGGQCSTPPNLAKKQLSQIDFNDIVKQRNDFNTTFCSIDCDCNFRHVDRMFVVKCAKEGLRQLRRFPNTQDLQYRFIELNIENQNVTEFPNLNLVQGSSNVLVVNACNNNIRHISQEMFPDSLKWLDLSKNKLVSIDENLIKMWNASKVLEKLWLSGNPWQCNCSTHMMKSFIYSNVSRVLDYHQIFCANKGGKGLHEIDDLCTNYNVLIISLCLSALLVTLLLTIYYKYREFFHVWLYGIFGRWITTYLSDKPFDAFISFAEVDIDYVFNLVQALENGPENYHLCIHSRDWIAAPIIQQIYESVHNSRYTIIVLSQGFLRSQWGLLEFRAAQIQANKERRSNVIMVMYGDINDCDIEDADAELKAYLHSNTYLKWNDPWFMNKLRYSLRRSRRERKSVQICETDAIEMTTQEVE